jgi:hypothetical protein
MRMVEGSDCDKGAVVAREMVWIARHYYSLGVPVRAHRKRIDKFTSEALIVQVP